MKEEQLFNPSSSSLVLLFFWRLGCSD